MAWVWWEWPRGETYEQLSIDFTIHNSIKGNKDFGLYLMLGNLDIDSTHTYFGLQTGDGDPHTPLPHERRVIYSRWDIRDLNWARWHETEGWSQSSGHEGDFIGVRRVYDWGAGDYNILLAPDGEPDDVGQWYGLWITDKATGVQTWIGSLKFPLVNGKARMDNATYATAEVYGRKPVRPIDIPEWYVSIERPLMDGAPAASAWTGYSWFFEEITNSDIRWDIDSQQMHIRVGGLTERLTEPFDALFSDLPK